MKKLIYIFLVAFTFACSEDFLEVTPTDSVGKADVISSPANMRTALNGVHRLMYQQSPIEKASNRAGEGYIMPLLEFGASDMLHSSGGNGWFRSRLKWLTHINPDFTDARYPWIHYYHLVANVNNIINAGEAMTKTDDLKNVLGQAYAYRAYSYFRLVQLYANSYTWGNPSSDPGLPIVLETKAPYLGTKRETVEKVYELITSDIEKSVSLLNEAPDSGDLSNISLSVAQGIAARVYLTKGNWTKAAEYAKFAEAGHSLMTESDYLKGFNSYTLPEMMWSGHIVSDQTTYYYAWFYYIGTNFNGTQNRTNPKIINRELFTEISDTDFRKKQWLEDAPDSYKGALKDPNYAPLIPDDATDEEKKVLEDAAKASFEADRKVIMTKYGITSRHYTTPYMSVKFLNKNPGSIDSDDVMYMRVSEMYLIEAEALCRGGQDDAAATALYNLVSSRDAAYVKSTKTGDALLQEILVQRRIELWGEGHRWLDMLRNDEALDLEGSGASSTLYSDGYKQDKPSTNSKWLFKIPSEEVNANPNINDADQN
ncbi:RagB/SusD family nutrient uptake outer membrane protein [Halosquirtibacter xylanolyticus]|uniref:RagB/SusD family nutrient uptake outer membrane protein n=1 Tax=Halosquirtibacter xylanolyticus TaxID=3374599 RepID=UPI0037490F1C|nr:RagB/SusD family nutrient uptake outer membrane protein [Prolixibacteraceae bacterium]